DLSILEEAESIPDEGLKRVGNNVEKLPSTATETSDPSLIRTLQSSTVEYGLIGTVANPKTYDARLPSDIVECSWSMSDHTIKLPYNIDAAYLGFDITNPQSQLYVTPDFAHLNMVLEEFANKMALRTGGLSGIKKLIDSKALGTAELSTGLQISGF